MSRRQLTAKQYDFLKYLQQYVRKHGVWPTYREIVDHFNYRSPNSVTQNLQALEKKGHLRREADGYQLVDRSPIHREASGIPVRGIITAGQLQEAVEEHLGTITLEMLFPSLDRIFAIRVSGQSMVGADINDGDYVLLMDDDIPNGGIGAVLYNGETSLKRVYYDEQGLRLEPANEEYSNIYIKPDVFEEVRILGRYVGHVNKNGIFKRTGRSTPAAYHA
ncbi:MAG TPA: transcriptional repressor LexA [Rhodothermales bacterium]|nr:transcriptional repressor LexA [Rhodothermales bacterium]